MPDGDASLLGIPESRAIPRRRTRLSPVWIIPIVAAAAGVWVAVARILGEGPQITIVFPSAEGLEAGKTKIRYNGVEVGTLTKLRLSDDHQRVVTIAQMVPNTDTFLVDDTQFWVVRARVSGANVTGLGTLISGAYVGMDIGTSKTRKREFAALDTPPVVTGNVPGRFFALKTPNLGSLDTGTPIFLRRLQVGEVASYALDPGGQSLTVKVFVQAPYDQYVTPNTRFWDASGIDVSLSATGLTVDTQSVLSILIGGIAFETPANGPLLSAAAPGTVFTLYADRATAFKLPARDPHHYLVVFDESVRGLAPGAPVEFKGIQIGEVAEVAARLDAKSAQFTVPVTVRLDMERLGVDNRNLPTGADFEAIRREVVDDMVAHGARAQLRTGNLLTGALIVAIDFFPDAPAATIDWSQNPPRLPTMPGQLAAIEATLVSIIKKIDELPLKALGNDLRKTFDELERTLVAARGTLEGGRVTLDSANRLIAPNSALAADLGTTLQEVGRAARAIRVLADYLERHPEALIRGKTGEAR